MATASVVLLCAAVVLALILNLALKPAYQAKLTVCCLVFSGIAGLCFYGAGLWELTHDLPLTLLRTTFIVFRMFIGVNELGAIASTRLVSTRAGLLCFWLAHLLAYYCFASAALNTLGAGLLRAIRFFLSGRGDLTLIYGINEDSTALGEECRAAGESVVFVAENPSSETVGTLNRSGMAVLSSPEANAAEQKGLRWLHLGRRRLTVYALDREDDKNLYFALRLKDTLGKLGVPAENTRVTLPGVEDIIGPMLQVSEMHYGFGYVNVFDRSMLAARAVIRTAPPWDYVSFGSDGRATEDFACVIAGFGSHGQAVFKQLVMNAQFAGSTFRAAIFSPNFENEAGYLKINCPELMRRYEPEVHRDDARSAAFYRYIDSRLSTLKLIVIATGDEKRNREITDDLMLYLKRCAAENICVVRCGEKGARYQERIGSPILTENIYTRAYLSAEEADRSAILLNAHYDSSDRTDWDKWVACDSFAKMSSRASADFMPAYIRASGCNREELIAGNWHPSEQMLRNLGETEHLRWNAFHFAMGYRPMSEEEFSANAERWYKCREEGSPIGFKISRNVEARTHACLVSWEELPALSERESAITGCPVDYWQLDINNVLALPELLRAEAGAKNSSAREEG